MCKEGCEGNEGNMKRQKKGGHRDGSTGSTPSTPPFVFFSPYQTAGVERNGGWLRGRCG